MLSTTIIIAGRKLRQEGLLVGSGQWSGRGPSSGGEFGGRALLAGSGILEWVLGKLHWVRSPGMTGVILASWLVGF